MRRTYTQTKKLNYLLLATMILMLPWVWSQQTAVPESQIPIDTTLSHTEVRKAIFSQKMQNTEHALRRFFPSLDYADKLFDKITDKIPNPFS